MAELSSIKDGDINCKMLVVSRAFRSLIYAVRFATLVRDVVWFLVRWSWAVLSLDDNKRHAGVSRAHACRVLYVAHKSSLELMLAKLSLTVRLVRFIITRDINSLNISTVYYTIRLVVNKNYYYFVHIKTNIIDKCRKIVALKK